MYLFTIQKKQSPIEEMKTLKYNLWCTARRAEAANRYKYLLYYSLRFYSTSYILFMYL